MFEKLLQAGTSKYRFYYFRFIEVFSGNRKFSWIAVDLVFTRLQYLFQLLISIYNSIYLIMCLRGIK